jgi:hypothetical protein
VTVVTAAGTLVTTVRDIEPAMVRSQPLEEVSQTLSSTGGPTWIRPAGMNSAPRSGATQDRRVPGVVTRVTAGGVLKMFMVDTLVGNETTGYTWTRRAVGVRPAQQVIPVVARSVARPRAILGTVREGVPVAPQGEGPSTAEEIGVISGVVDMAVSEPDIPASSLGESITTVGVPEGEATSPTTRSQMSARSRQELSNFISTAVLPKTNRVYEKEWEAFKAFVKKETGSDDPFLTKYTDNEKATLVALMMMRRHEAGKRGKAASSFLAAVRQMYAMMTLPTAFLESSLIATARKSCAPKPSEPRALKDNRPVATVKLPVCEGILMDMPAMLWLEGWSDDAKRINAMSAGTMYGWKTAGRASEFTHCEQGSPDHCARNDDFKFVAETPAGTKNVLGSRLAALLLADSVEGRLHILECRVRTISSKVKVVVKPKLMARRSPEKAEFLEDLAAWIIHSGASGMDEVFSFRKNGTIVRLTRRLMRDEIKKTCASNGLPPDYFSAHSLRKGAITHMRAQGATKDDRRDRGNYAAGSTVMNSVYDYATGLGPSASNSLEGGHHLDKKDLKRMTPPARESV